MRRDSGRGARCSLPLAVVLLVASALCPAVEMSVGSGGAVSLPLGVVESPHLGDVLFRHYAGDASGALVRALAYEDSGRLGPQSGRARFLIASMLLDAGLAEPAEQRFLALLESAEPPNTDAGVSAAAAEGETSAADVVLENEVFLALGRLAQRRGDHAVALEHFARVAEPSLSPRIALAAAASELSLGRSDAAAERLQRWQGPPTLAPWARYNLAVALLRAGRDDVAVEVLEAIGAQPSVDGVLGQVLRDRANLAAGQALLLAGDHARAERALLRVSSSGVLRDQGLVALGWIADARGEAAQAIGYWRQVGAADAADSEGTGDADGARRVASSLPRQAARLEASLAIAHGLGALERPAAAAQRYQATLGALAEADSALRRIEDEFPGWLAATTGGERAGDDSGTSVGVAAGTAAVSVMLPESVAGPLVPIFASAEFAAQLGLLREVAAERRALAQTRARLDVLTHAVDGNRLRAESVPAVREAAVEQAASLRARRAELARAQRITTPLERARSLATDAQADAMARLDALADAPALPAAGDAAVTKLRVLRGHLQWQLERDADYRAWRVRRGLRRLDEALEALPVAFQRAVQARTSRPQDVDRFATTIAALRARTAAAEAQAQRLAAARAGALQAVVARHLRRQRARLDGYRIDATYALALLHDRGVRGRAPGAAATVPVADGVGALDTARAPRPSSQAETVRTPRAVGSGSR